MCARTFIYIGIAHRLQLWNQCLEYVFLCIGEVRLNLRTHLIIVIANEIVRDTSLCLTFSNEVAYPILISKEISLFQIKIGGLVDGTNIAHSTGRCHQFITTIHVSIGSHISRVGTGLYAFIQLEIHTTLVSPFETHYRNALR